MKIKLVLILFAFIIQTVFVTAQTPVNLSAKNIFSVPNKAVAANPTANLFQNGGGKFNLFAGTGFATSANQLNGSAVNCAESDELFAPDAIGCNGVSVTPINFTNANRTPATTTNTVGEVYRYANAGTAPDGTVLDALVTITGYTNNQDDSPTVFSTPDITGIGFTDNLQPSISQGTDGYTAGATSWSGNITYNIKFVVTGTNLPKRITVAATTIDNDGSNVPSCSAANPAFTTGGATVQLRESVTYSPAPNQYLLSTTPATKQTIAGNTVNGPPGDIQPDIGIGGDYAASALFVNVNEVNWTYGFATVAPMYGCNNIDAEPRYGSLNMSCQIDFTPNFRTVTISGNVFNDTNGLSDNTVNNTVTGTTGTNAGGLFANLYDSNNTVVATATVAADGTYSFTIPAGVAAQTYTVQISTNQGIESSPAPVRALPVGWANTGERLGTGAGSDGTPDGLLAVTVPANATAAITNVNFGIEQRPVTTNRSVASQANPGGTNTFTIPPATFASTDPVTATVSSIRITAFPSNATSITIGGTLYTAATFATTFPNGATVATNAAGNPTLAILVDPIDGAVTVAIPYVAIDAAGIESTPATVSVPFGGSSISGTVFNDLNGLTGTPANTVDGTGTNAGGPLYAILVNTTNQVVQSVLVTTGGAYSFPGVAAGSYTVQLSTTTLAVGSTAPAMATLPNGWVSTGENVGAGAGSEVIVDSRLAVTVLVSGDVINANFGIEQPPTANSSTLASQTRPGGIVNVNVPVTSFTATDPVSSTVSNIRITAFPSNSTSITVGPTTYYATTLPTTCPTTTCLLFPAAGVIVPTNAAGNPTQIIAVDPAPGVTIVEIRYVAIDQAGRESLAPAIVRVPFGDSSISGTVFNDTNGATDSTVNGTGTNVAANSLFAVLVNNNLATNNVVASVAVNADGTYSFSGVAAGSYTVQLSTTALAVNTTAPATGTLPAGYVSTSEFPSLSAGNDGTTDGRLTPFTIAAGTNVVNANFGIEQRPTAINNTAAGQANLGGTNNSPVPAGTFSATDPVTNTVTNIRITAFPTNTTSFRVGTTNYYRNTAAIPAGCTSPTCVVFDTATGVTVPTNAAGNPTSPILVDPINGVLTVAIPFVAIDQAGIESAAPATASVPFTSAPTSANGNISGTVSFGGSPIRNALVVLIDTSSNAKVFTRTDASGKYLFSDKAVGKTYIIQPLSSKYEFSPATNLVNLLDNAPDRNFESAAKTYRPKNDFDGDGKTDVAVFRPSDAVWYVLRSSDEQLSSFKFGIETDTPVSADFDGDGKTDYAVFRPSEGTWYIWQSATQDLRVENFGVADDKLVPADYDGDGKADVAVYRQGIWYIHRSSDNSFEAKNFGSEADTPVAEDFDGDGKADVAVYRPSDATWYVSNSSNNSFSARRFGQAKDDPAAGDFDGDGFADIAQFRNGYWYVLNSTTDFEASQFGESEDRSIVGDYDGDGRADTTVFRDGLWSIRNSGSGTLRSLYFGEPTDVLVK